MSELRIVLAPLLLVIGIAVIAQLASVYLIAQLAAGLFAAGLLIGGPAGLYYHVLLRRELQKLGPLPSRWYFQPQRHHADLPPGRWPRVRLFFYLGGFGYALLMTGLLLALSALALWFRGGQIGMLT